jgi:hypothetical protein
VPSHHHQAGSGRTVAAAVAQAFAVRAAAGRGGAQRPDDPPADDGSPPEPDPGPVAAEAADDVDPAATTDPDGLGVAAGAVLPDAGWTAQAQPVPEPATAPATVPAPRSDNGDPGRQADPRDRLLAVLLDDPDRAVGAMVELESCLSELDRLSDAVRAGRAALRDVLHRLAAAGLRPDQLARLAGMPQAEVQELLEAAPAEQQAWS